LTRLLFIVYFLEVGLLLVFVPWLAFWDRNYFSHALPFLGAVMRNDFVRGAVTGLGVINIAAGLAELFSLFTARHH
jgi:hypothetical protein